MSGSTEFIWSNTDYPYLCLIDQKRTTAFKSAIQSTVMPGDIVVEVGAGTGILSLFAAGAGAAHVYAIEVDPILADSLRKTVQANDMGRIIEVIEANALGVDLPENVDVVIGELIETGLMDEMQIEVMNGLHSQGVIGAKTKVIPQAYETCLQLLDVENKFFGYKIAAPIHNWPYYSKDSEEWAQIRVIPVSGIQKVGYYNFEAGYIKPLVDTTLEFSLDETQSANALGLSGIIHFTDKTKFGAFNSLNGDKIFMSDDLSTNDGIVKLRISYEMSKGLGSLKIIRLDA